MHKDVIAFANDCLQKGQPTALAILTESGRDTPGVPGGMMALSAAGARCGTLGGGAAEAKVLQDCRKALQDGTDTFAFDYSQRAEGGLGMVCGGDMRGFGTVLRLAPPPIVCGGGYVGQESYEAGR